MLFITCKKQDELNSIELYNVGDTAIAENYFKYLYGVKKQHSDSVHFDPKYFGKGPFYTTYLLYFSVKKFKYDDKPASTCGSINGYTFKTNKILTENAELEVPYVAGRTYHIEFYFQSSNYQNSKKSIFDITLPN